MQRKYFYLTSLVTILTLIVIVVGAYTRLADAGLGCPDWPGCYGSLTVPKTEVQLARAAELFPGEEIEVKKAWIEMIHRYIAGFLGLMLLVIALFSTRQYYKQTTQPIAFKPPVKLAWFLVALVIFQAALGMWTVTWQLLPLVVMGHLLGGMTILSLVWWLALTGWDTNTVPYQGIEKLRIWAVIGLVLVAGQIALGAWTSANYAAIICPDFPTCQGAWLPQLDFKDAFNLAAPIGINYQDGVLGNSARVTIQFTHRVGALVVGLYIGLLALFLILKGARFDLQKVGVAVLTLLVVQISIGIYIVTHFFPLLGAAAHNAFAALLLISMVTLVYRVFAKPRRITHAN